jgi:RHS repeat-associated protein
VIGLVDQASGTTSGEYDYNAFGETVKAVGTAASANPFRFSTKYTDSETGHLYYGLRYYSPNMGRWLSRDPIGERGGLSLYAICANDPIGRLDYVGLQGETVPGNVLPPVPNFPKDNQQIGNAASGVAGAVRIIGSNFSTGLEGYIFNIFYNRGLKKCEAENYHSTSGLCRCCVVAVYGKADPSGVGTDWADSNGRVFDKLCSEVKKMFYEASPSTRRTDYPIREIKFIPW